MDRHAKPYVCEEPGCEKIQGFAYLGGLLRHQCDVHNKHGGPRIPYMCPHRDCKRSTGVGFSRKENLQEHVRRVHNGVEAVPDEMETNKRRRVSYHGQSQLDTDNELTKLRSEIKRLKSEADDKDASSTTLEKLVFQALREKDTTPLPIHPAKVFPKTPTSGYASHTSTTSTYPGSTARTESDPENSNLTIPSSHMPLPPNHNTPKSKPWLEDSDETSFKVDELLARWTFLVERSLQRT